MIILNTNIIASQLGATQFELNVIRTISNPNNYIR